MARIRMTRQRAAVNRRRMWNVGRGSMPTRRKILSSDWYRSAVSFNEDSASLRTEALTRGSTGYIMSAVERHVNWPRGQHLTGEFITELLGCISSRTSVSPRPACEFLTSRKTQPTAVCDVDGRNHRRKRCNPVGLCSPPTPSPGPSETTGVRAVRGSPLNAHARRTRRSWSQVVGGSGRIRSSIDSLIMHSSLPANSYVIRPVNDERRLAATNVSSDAVTDCCFAWTDRRSFRACVCMRSMFEDEVSTSVAADSVKTFEVEPLAAIFDILTVWNNNLTRSVTR